LALALALDGHQMGQLEPGLLEPMRIFETAGGLLETQG
jgi:hypothetical protein